VKNLCCDEESRSFVDDVPLEILEDDGAFVEGAGRSVCVQFESGNETLGRDFEEVFGFLIRIYFVCAIASAAKVNVKKWESG
jgi:hypothetical protein